MDIDNPIGAMGVTRVREFLRINPPEFYDSKVDEHPNVFIDEVHKVLAIMGVFSNKEEDFSTY